MTIENKKSIFFILPLLLLLFFSCDSFTPLETRNIKDEVYSVNCGFVNLYLVKHQQGYIAVDSGIKSGSIRKELEKLNIDPGQVTHIFLTHADRDHASGIKLFTNAAIHVSKEEAKHIDGTIKRKYTGNFAPEYTYLKDGQTIEINDLEINCFLTPGHTIGSMSYLISRKYLFIGDAASINDSQLQLFTTKYNMDNDKCEESIEKIKAIDAEYVFTGHHGVIINVK